MFWYMEAWACCLAWCQQGWLEAARHWGAPLAGFSGPGFFPAPGLANRFTANAADPKNGEAWDTWSQSILATLPSGAWPPPFSAACFPRIEAQIEPFLIEGAEQAVRLSMRIFTPWGGEPLWVEALMGQREAGEITARTQKILPRKPE
ncbi:MAG: hypothetical protein LBO00_06410 [Zoogloeaceae bacterium]|jgi:hypothetical protein|nr:hypothetical protein [Zoogloeaceae bacterium]